MDVGSIAARAVYCVLLPHRAASRSYPEGIPNESQRHPKLSRSYLEGIPKASRSYPEVIPNITATSPCPNLVPFLSAGWGCSETLHLLSLPLCSRCGVPTATKESEFAPFLISEGSRCGVPTATKESEFALFLMPEGSRCGVLTHSTNHSM